MINQVNKYTHTHIRNDFSHCFTDSLTYTQTHTHSTKQCKSMRARARVLRNYANAKTKVEIVTASKKIV